MLSQISDFNYEVCIFCFDFLSHKQEYATPDETEAKLFIVIFEHLMRRSKQTPSGVKMVVICCLYGSSGFHFPSTIQTEGWLFPQEQNIEYFNFGF